MTKILSMRASGRLNGASSRGDIQKNAAVVACKTKEMKSRRRCTGNGARWCWKIHYETLVWGDIKLFFNLGNKCSSLLHVIAFCLFTWLYIQWLETFFWQTGSGASQANKRTLWDGSRWVCSAARPNMFHEDHLHCIYYHITLLYKFTGKKNLDCN